MSVFWQRHRVDFGELVNKYARDTLVPSGSEVFTERKNRKVNGEFELLLK